MTIAQLRDLIADLPADMPVKVLYAPRYQPIGLADGTPTIERCWIMGFDEDGRTYGTGESYEALVFAGDRS
jgi:hypothetical protein